MSSESAKSAMASTVHEVETTKMERTPKLSISQPESRLPMMVTAEQEAPQKVCAVAESSGGTSEKV